MAAKNWSGRSPALLDGVRGRLRSANTIRGWHAVNSRFALLGVFALASAAACTHEATVHFEPSAIHTEGGAKYSTELLSGEHGPSDHDGTAATPKVSPDFRGVPETNHWWSSLVWAYDGKPYSRPMFPHPLAVQAAANGLGVGYPAEAQIGPRAYHFPYAEDLRISTTGLNAPDTRVQSSSDWAVTAVWTDGPRHLEATFGHGLPFVYVRTGAATPASEEKGAHDKGDKADKSSKADKADKAEKAGGADARILLADGAQIWGARGEVMGVTVHGHDYGLFAPTGATWKKDGNVASSDLGGKGFFSVAVLPDHSPETLELFRRHAYAFVTGTRVTWRYEAREAKVVSHFEVKTTLVEPGADRVDEPIVALYPHQWKATHAPLAKAAYVTSRGAMRVLAAGSFDVERPFHGVLPVLPAVADGRSQIASYLADESSASDLFPVGLDGKKDSYWAGKSLGRVSTLAWIAHGLGDTDTTARLVRALAGELNNWFDGTPPERFYYDAKWGTLIGFPAGYQSDTQMNDHHFHYGYFIWAAATVAALDPTGGEKERWAPFIKLLIKDVVNTDDADTRFPRLRFFDPYAGHSWASGAAMFDDGNNEESSSEDVNFAAALTLWGSITGDAAARDLGAFLYETEVSAVEQYWLDVDHDVFPAGYGHPVAGIVWGDGALYDTWWDRNPVYVHGINMLPFTGASLYLGRHPAAIRAGEDLLEAHSHGAIRQWRDVLWMDFALDDAKKAASLADKDHFFAPEFGNSWTATFAWIRALAALGQVDPGVLADTTSYAVFHKDRARTYAAYNPAAVPLHVTFTDGATLDVPPGTMRTSTGAVH
jgi:endoglucanase Acf2